jgi:uncharacterized protein (TIRG00374 family)
MKTSSTRIDLWITWFIVGATLYVWYLFLRSALGFILLLLSILALPLLAILIALVIDPAVTRLEKIGIPRSIGALFIYLVGICFLGMLGLFAWPDLIHQINSLVHEVGSYKSVIAAASANIEDWLKHNGIPLHINPKTLITSTNLVGIGSAAVVIGTRTVEAILGAVVVLVLAYWLVVEEKRLKAMLAKLPEPWNRRLVISGQAIGFVLGGYVRAQLVMAALIGTLAGAGTATLGVKAPLFIGVSAGLLELVPFVGPFAGGALALLIALTQSPLLALATLLYFILIHLIEAYVVGPRIMGRFVQVHPAIVLISVIVGAEIGGLAGAILVVPSVAIASVAVKGLIYAWRGSDNWMEQALADITSRRERVYTSAIWKFLRSLERRFRRNSFLRYWPFGISLLLMLIIVGLSNPYKIGHAISGVNWSFMPLLLSLDLVFYILRSIRWYYVLRALDIDVDRKESIALFVAARATSMVPLGETMRGLLLRAKNGTDLGTATSSVTFQELTYGLLMLIVAIPASLHYTLLFDVVIISAGGILLVFLMLDNAILFKLILAITDRVPFLASYHYDIMSLRLSFGRLVRSRTAIGSSIIDGCAAIFAFLIVYICARAVGISNLGFLEVATIYALANLAGAVSALPGGLGAYEASLSGLIHFAGVPLGAAFTVALVQGLVDKIWPAFIGLIVMLVIRPRLDVNALNLKATSDIKSRAASGESHAS